MSRGSIDIYGYLNEKVLLRQGTTNYIPTANSTLNLNVLNKNGIEFRNCSMILAIQNESQLNHAKSNYPMENQSLLKDNGMFIL